MSIPSGINSHQSHHVNWVKSLRYPSIYLILIAAAEVVTSIFPSWGIAIHFTILAALLAHSVFVTEKSLSDFLASMTIAPLTRIFSLTTPLTHFSHLSWFMIISIPVFVAAFTIAHVQKVSAREMFLSRPKLHHLPTEMGVIILAFPIGLLEYQILRPSPMVEFGFPALLAPSLLFIVCTGFLEEMIFRGLMQHNAERLAGFQGIVFVSLLFGALHITNLVFWDALLAGGLGFLFALVVRRTGSIWGVSVAHGCVNIMLFLIAPYLLV